MMISIAANVEKNAISIRERSAYQEIARVTINPKIRL